MMMMMMMMMMYWDSDENDRTDSDDDVSSEEPDSVHQSGGRLQYHIELVRERLIAKFKIKGSDYKVRVASFQRDVPFDQVVQVLHDVIEDILRDLTSNIQPHDKVPLTIRVPTMDQEIWLLFMTLDQLTADRVMVEVDCIIQSNDEWLFGDFVINFIHASLPACGGLIWGVYVQ